MKQFPFFFFFLSFFLVAFSATDRLVPIVRDSIGNPRIKSTRRNEPTFSSKLDDIGGKQSGGRMASVTKKSFDWLTEGYNTCSTFFERRNASR